jgi:iron complex transport system ATP-binding protein
MIEVNEITVKAGKKTLLQNISFALNPGEVVALIGSNGAGKSTLLRAIAGEQPVEQGTVFINEKPLSMYNSAQLSRTRAVFSQSVHVAFPLSVLEIVLMGRYIYKHRERAASAADIAY